MRPLLLRFFVIALFISAPGAGHAQVDELHLTLLDAVKQAVSSSDDLGAVEAEYQAAAQRVAQRKASLLPTLSLEGSWRYVSEVPTLTAVPGREIPFGDSASYSIGPVLNWTLLDFSATRKAVKSGEGLADSKKQEALLAKKQITFATKMAYFTVLLSAEQLNLLSDALKLAQAQDRDIRQRLRAGALSQMDASASRKEVLSQELQFRRAQADLATNLADLLTLIRWKEDLDLTRPADARMGNASGMEPVTLVLRLDRLEDVLAAFPSTTVISPENHPSVKVFQTQADAQRLSAESSRATRLPRVQLFAKSSMDYPNGPNLETIHQNTVGVTLSMPFFEGGRIKGESQERESLAKSAEHRFANARENLLREVKKARNRLDATRSQQAILKESSNESQRLARLSYASYRAGRSSFLEVQSANLKVLEARILEAQNQVQALMQLAILESLAGEK